MRKPFILYSPISDLIKRNPTNFLAGPQNVISTASNFHLYWQTVQT